MKLKDWLEDAKYLPEFMRDFHDQKKLFKRIDDLNWSADMMGSKPNWIIGQIYVIDLFLWFMARHGYTLQKSRQKFEFEDIYNTMDEAEKKRYEMLKSIMQERKQQEHAQPNQD